MEIRGRRRVLFPLFLILILAGCVGPEVGGRLEPTASPGHPVPDTGRTAWPGRVGGLDDWFYLHVDSRPAGSVAGFVWQPPPGAFMPDPDWDGRRTLLLEILPVRAATPSPAHLDWAFAAFHLQEGSATYTGSVLAPEMVSEGGPTSPQAGVVSSPGAFGFPIRVDENVTSETVGIVLGAKSGLPMEFGLALRIVHPVPPFQERRPAADSPNEFFKDAQGEGILLASHARGEGLLTAFFRLQETPEGRSTFRSRDVEVEETQSQATSPVLALHDLRLKTESSDPGGWALNMAFTVALAGAVDWSVKADIHGLEVEERFATVDSAVAAPDAVGYPSFRIMRDGPGPAASTLHIRSAAAALWVVTFVHLDFGETVGTLLGADAEPVWRSGAGAVGNLPPEPAAPGSSPGYAAGWVVST